VLEAGVVCVFFDLEEGRLVSGDKREDWRRFLEFEAEFETVVEVESVEVGESDLEVVESEESLSESRERLCCF